MFQRRITKVSIVLILSAALMWWNPASFFSPIRSGLWSVSEPFALMFQSVRLHVGGFFSFFSSLGSIKKENEALRDEVQHLSAQVAEVQDLKQENERLRTGIGLLPRGEFHTISSIVVSSHSDDGDGWIVLNKGSRDGVETGSVVLGPSDVLVGRVDEVLATTSRVKLIAHPESVVNVRAASTGAKGIARGQFGLGLIFDMALQTDTLQTGDKVVTSEIAVDMPAGLYVGDIGELHVDEEGIFQWAPIISPIDFSDLFLVSIIGK